MSTTTDDRFELSQTQMNDLLATGMPEEDIYEEIEDLRKTFPDGGITKENFLEMMLGSGSSSLDAKHLNVVNHVVDTIDRDKSGKIDIYEYMLIMGLLQDKQPKLTMKCLFKLFDSDHDGFLTKDEIVNVFSIFTISSHSIADDQEEIKISVNKAFAGKTQVSEQEFYQLCTENKDIKELCQKYQTVLTSTLFLDTDDK